MDWGWLCSEDRLAGRHHIRGWEGTCPPFCPTLEGSQLVLTSACPIPDLPDPRKPRAFGDDGENPGAHSITHDPPNQVQSPGPGAFPILAVGEQATRQSLRNALWLLRAPSSLPWTPLSSLADLLSRPSCLAGSAQDPVWLGCHCLPYPTTQDSTPSLPFQEAEIFLQRGPGLG